MIPHRLRALVLLLASGWALAGCGPPTEEANCEQLIADRKYQRAVRHCEDPIAVSTAYMGLAGFEFITYVRFAEPSNLAAYLELDAGNVAAKRRYLNRALREVRRPETTAQAFSLLVSAFLGMSVTVEEYLDNGAGSATAFDNTLEDPEIVAATGLTLDPAFAAPTPFIETPPYFQIVSAGGTPYLVDCDADISTPICDGTGGPVTIHGDPDGSATSFPNPVGATPDLAAADPVGLAVMLGNFSLPFGVDAAELERLASFLGSIHPDPDLSLENPELFSIGLLGYLDAMSRATDVILAGAGQDDEAQAEASVLRDSIDELRAKLDNGATCLSNASIVPTLNLLHTMYAAAPGTADQPAAGITDFTTYNRVPQDKWEAVNFLIPESSDYVFTASIGTKMLYPKVSGLGGFDASQATPRIDRTFSDFERNFNFIPFLVGGEVKAGDDRVDAIELFCVEA